MTRPARPTFDPAFRDAWNDPALTLAAVAAMAGISAAAAQVRAARLRRAGHPMIVRRTPGAPGGGRVKPEDAARRDAEIARVWNDASLGIDAVAGRLGLTRKGLLTALRRLRAKNVELAERGGATPKTKPVREAAPVPLPDGDAPRTVGHAADLLLRQKRDLRFAGERVYLDGRLITLVELFDQAYGPPQGKWR